MRGWIADQTPARSRLPRSGWPNVRTRCRTCPTIDVPTLVITGTLDRLIPPDVTAGIADRVHGAELLRIEDAGHLSNLEAPEAFTDALDGVLTGLGL